MKRLQAATFFSTEEKERIRHAIAAAETTTAGEIVPMVVDRSDPYEAATLAAAVLVTAIGALVAVLSSGHDSVWYYLPTVAGLFVPIYLLARHLPFLSLPFISRRRMERAVRDRAQQVFFEQGLHRTINATGVLLFISLFERRVWILGDRGINERIDPQEWETMVRQLVQGIREERAADALCTVIGRCGALLRTHFPRQQADKNELSDEVIVG
jgi:putative membrane protein